MTLSTSLGVRRTPPRTTTSRRIAQLAVLPGLALVPSPAVAALPVPQPGGEVVSDAHELHSQGQADAALELLKSAHSADPENEGITVALAQAYAQKKNYAWAVRVLSKYLDEHETACIARLQLAWIHLLQGITRQSRQLLDQDGCTSPPEVLARRQLLIAYLDLLEDRRELMRQEETQRKSSTCLK